MLRSVVTPVATILAVVSLLQWADVDLAAQTRPLSLNIGDENETFGVELVEGPRLITPTAARYCVRLPAGSTLDHYSAVTKRVGETPASTGSSTAAGAISARASGAGAASTTAPTAWIQLEARSASLYYVNAEGGVDGAQWDTRPPRMFIRRDERGRIIACVGKPGMQPPAIP
jgi:hypothetical protein